MDDANGVRRLTQSHSPALFTQNYIIPAALYIIIKHMCTFDNKGD